MNDQEREQEAKLQRAGMARQVLDNSAYREAMLMVRASLVDGIASVNTRDVEAMRDSVQQLKNLDRIEKTLNTFYEKGKVILHKRSKLAKLTRVS